MTDSSWAPDVNGVRVFKPAKPTGPAEYLSNPAEDMLSPSDHRKEFAQLTPKDSVKSPENVDFDSLPRYGIELAIRVKSEPTDSNANNSFSPPDTSSVGSHDYYFGDSPPSSSLGELIFDQLKRFAASSEDGSPNSDISALSSTSSIFTTTSDIESSPCSRRHGTSNIQRTGKTSSHFKNEKSRKPKRAKIQRPDWIKTKGGGGKTVKTDNMLSLENLRDIERSPRHLWTHSERELLCVLFRWYERNPIAFGRIWNSIFELNLPTRKIQNQFENHLRLYGEKAYPVFGAVFTTPFEGIKYEETREIIEAEAQALGIQLHRLEAEVISLSGNAAKAKSVNTRRFYKSLVRRARASKPANTSTRGQVATGQVATSQVGTIQPLGGVALKTNDYSNLEEFVDVEEAPTPSTKTAYLSDVSTTSYHLAFRVWDDDSRTVFKDDYGFVADLFAHRRAPVPQPLSKSDNMFDILANAHLSFRGNASAFVSVASSLLQVLNYSGKMKHPRLAVINLQHPDLMLPEKLHSAHQIIKNLQAQGEMSWTKYKATAEFIIWGDLPNSAILHTFNLSELNDLIAVSPTCANLLNLDLFDGASRTRAISQQLREKGIIMNVDTAKAMGKIARVFGLGGPDVTYLHIDEFVTSLVDGWNIQGCPINDIHTASHLGMHFALAMECPRSSLNIQQIMGAFIDGIEHGTRNLDYFATRRPRFERRRTT